MRIKYTIEFDLPDESLEPHPDFAEGLKMKDPNAKPELVIAKHAIWDSFTNFAICQHIVTQMEWMMKEEKSPNKGRIASSHKNWADIISKAASTVVIEEIIQNET